MSDFPAVPLILDRKTPGHVHIVAGDLRCHIDFLAEIVGKGAEVRRVQVNRLEDAPVVEALQAPEPIIFMLDKASTLSIAADTRARVGVWTAAPLKRRTAGVRILVRHAMLLMELKDLESERVDQVGDTILDNLGDDALPQALIWEAAWLLTDPAPGQAPATWPHPWEHPWNWARGDFPMSMRLQVLYKDLAAYVFSLDNDWKCAQTLGISPSRFAWLKTLRLDVRKVEKAILVLSRWRTKPDKGTAVQAALEISSIFV